MRRWWLALSSVLLAGCGAMVNGPTQHVKISTIPPGAALTVDGRRLSSPARVNLERGRNYSVSARMAGFEPGTAEIRSRADKGVKVGNCVFFLCVPQLWEAGKASQRRLEPQEVEITLNPVGWSPR